MTEPANPIKAARDAVGMTQENLAYGCGLSLSTIANAETGRNEPTITSLRKIAAFLSIDIVSLIDAPTEAAS